MASAVDLHELGCRNKLWGKFYLGKSWRHLFGWVLWSKWQNPICYKLNIYSQKLARFIFFRLLCFTVKIQGVKSLFWFNNKCTVSKFKMFFCRHVAEQCHAQGYESTTFHWLLKTFLPHEYNQMKKYPFCFSCIMSNMSVYLKRWIKNKFVVLLSCWLQPAKFLLLCTVKLFNISCDQRQTSHL